MKTDDATKDSAEIRAMIVRWAGAVRARDIRTILANHSEDILMFDVPPPAQLRGIEAYKKSWEPFFASFGDKGVWDISDIAVHAGGDVAFATALVLCRGCDGVDLSVRLTVGLRKFGGAWKVVHEHHSVPAA
jgi:ketosteroid isomerase-like protein